MDGRLGDFVKIRTVGRGSFGDALLVRHRATGVECVLKRVRLGGLSAQSARAATQEGDVLQRLQHPNIVAFLGAFVDARSESFCLLTAFCARGDLQAKLQRVRGASSRLTEVQVLNWFQQLSEALAHVHANSILHRDLKPSNIFLTAAGAGGAEAVAIGDFGISRTLGNTQDLAMTAVGTPCYLSPEVCKGVPYSYKADVWSLGCVLYEMAALKCAFAPTGGSIEALIAQIVRAEYPIPARLVAAYPLVVKSVRAVLLLDPSRRPSAVTCASWAAQALHTLGVGALSSAAQPPTGTSGARTPSKDAGAGCPDVCSNGSFRPAAACTAVRGSVTREELAAQILEKEHEVEAQQRALNGREEKKSTVTRAELASRILEAEAQKRQAQLAWRDTEATLLQGDENAKCPAGRRSSEHGLPKRAPCHRRQLTPMRVAENPSASVGEAHLPSKARSSASKAGGCKSGRRPTPDSRSHAGPSADRCLDHPRHGPGELGRGATHARAVPQWHRDQGIGQPAALESTPACDCDAGLRSSCPPRVRSKSCDSTSATAVGENLAPQAREARRIPVPVAQGSAAQRVLQAPSAHQLHTPAAAGCAAQPPSAQSHAAQVHAEIQAQSEVVAHVVMAAQPQGHPQSQSEQSLPTPVQAAPVQATVVHAARAEALQQAAAAVQSQDQQHGDGELQPQWQTHSQWTDEQLAASQVQAQPQSQPQSQAQSQPQGLSAQRAAEDPQRQLKTLLKSKEHARSLSPGCVDRSSPRVPKLRDESPVPPRQVALEARREKRIQSQRDFRGWLQRQRSKKGGATFDEGAAVCEGQADFEEHGIQPGSPQHRSSRNDENNASAQLLVDRCYTGDQGATLSTNGESHAALLKAKGDSSPPVPVIRLVLCHGDAGVGAPELLLRDPRSRQSPKLAASPSKLREQHLYQWVRQQQPQPPPQQPQPQPQVPQQPQPQVPQPHQPHQQSRQQSQQPQPHHTPGLVHSASADTPSLHRSYSGQPLDSSSRLVPMRPQTSSANAGAFSVAAGRVGDTSRPVRQQLSRHLERRSCSPVSSRARASTSAGVGAAGVRESLVAPGGGASVADQLEQMRASLEQQLGTRPLQELYGMLQKARCATASVANSAAEGTALPEEVARLRPAVASLVACDREFYQ